MHFPQTQGPQRQSLRPNLNSRPLYVFPQHILKWTVDERPADPAGFGGFTSVNSEFALPGFCGLVFQVSSQLHFRA